MNSRQFLVKTVTTLVPAAILARLTPSRGPAIPEETWDHQHTTGYWDFLAGIEELSRYSAIAGYCQFLKPAARVLDVGCGTGLLAERLSRDRMSAYLGIDLSPAAIERARRLDLENVEFIVGNAATFEPSQVFDIIIFNEILYYLKRPEVHAQRYASHLAPGGHLIVSMWYCASGLRAWKRLDRKFDTLDRVRITHPSSRKRFDVAILKPR